MNGRTAGSGALASGTLVPAVCCCSCCNHTCSCCRACCCCTSPRYTAASLQGGHTDTAVPDVAAARQGGGGVPGGQGPGAARHHAGCIHGLGGHLPRGAQAVQALKRGGREGRGLGAQQPTQQRGLSSSMGAHCETAGPAAAAATLLAARQPRCKRAVRALSSPAAACHTRTFAHRLSRCWSRCC